MKQNPAIGQEREHRLVGSVAWAEQKQADADTRLHTFDLNAAIVRAIRDWMGAAHQTVAPLAFDGEGIRGSAHDTETGVQLPPHFVNVVDINHALERLSWQSEEAHRRYLDCCIGWLVTTKEGEAWTTRAIADVAADDGVAPRVVSDSLYFARKFLRHAILDAALHDPA